MNEEIYERLAETIQKKGGAAPAIKCKEFYALLNALFLPEEAELTAKMPMGAVTLTELVEKTGSDTKETERILEQMADKGIVFCRDTEGTRFYSLMPLVPGIFEIQFTKGEFNDHNKKLAKLFDDYFKVIDEQVMKPLVESGSKIKIHPFSRVIAVEQEISSPDIEIHTYDKVSVFIAEADMIAVSTCYCRHHGELIGNPCEKSKEVCMSFGPQAKYIVDRGFGREVTQEEARGIIDLTEEEGLIHCSSNTGNYLTFICNCCECHCGVIQSVKKGILPMLASSGFTVALDEDKCTLCGNCEDRCQMDALVLDDESARLTSALCIGCGLCVSTCDGEALSMKARETAPIPSPTNRELDKEMASVF